MQHWTEIGQITTGGTVLSIVERGGQAWLGSRAGLFRQTAKGWRPVVREVPFWGTSGVLQASGELLVAGLPNGLIRSGDAGQQWRQATIEQTMMPITCLAASSSYHDDGIVLAGTAGDGVLRSSDGGRYWEVQTWGLDNLDVLAVAIAPKWGRRQFAIVSTADGIYRSPNGGRAWQRMDAPDGAIVPALLYVSAEIILGGTEVAGLIVSNNGGQTWRQHPSALDGMTINALLQTTDGTLLAATGEGVIGLSADLGATWQAVRASETPILALCQEGDHLLAGVVDNGLLRSTNRAQSWQVVEGVQVHRFAWLAAGVQMLAAAGPETGIWLSSDMGATWQLRDDGPSLTHLTLAAHQLFAIRGRQILQFDLTDAQAAPSVVFEPNDEPLWIEARAARLWVGLEGGAIMFRPNAAADWQALAVPFKRQRLLGFAISADFDADRAIIAVTQDGNDLNIWQSNDAGQTWRQTLNERRLASAPQLAFSKQVAAVSVGNLCYVNTGSGWQQHYLDDAAAPIMSLALTEGKELLAISADNLHRFDGQRWRSTRHQVELAAVDLHYLSELPATLALTHEGRILRLD